MYKRQALLSMTGLERHMTRILFITAPVGITLSVLLTMMFGINGAAMATASTVALYHLLFSRAAKRHLWQANGGAAIANS